MADVSSPVGPREGQGGYENFHKGVDISVPIGTEVRAVADGTVVMHYPAPNGHYKGHEVFGGYVVINHGRGTGLHTAYAHLSETRVNTGQYVFCGEVIGLSGSSGVSTGPHLHLEVFHDPLTFLGAPW